METTPRQFGPFYKNVSTYFTSLNRGKESIKLDLKKKKDLNILLKLIEKADVLVENFRPGTMDKLGLKKESYLIQILDLFTLLVQDLVKLEI